MRTTPVTPTSLLLLRAVTRPGLPLYVGAVTNRMNYGDELLYVAHEVLLDSKLSYLPFGGRNRLASVRARARAPFRLLLGGGTLIGRPAYRIALETAATIGGSGSLFSVLGVGVSAPTVHGKSSASEMNRWAALLRQFPAIRVRGPRSQQYLADIGVTSQLVGDPALGYLRSAGLEPGRGVGLALNVGSVKGIGDALPALVQAVATYLRSTGNLSATILVAAPHDLGWSQKLAFELDRVMVRSRTVQMYALPAIQATRVLAQHEVVVAVRLHALVAAAACGVRAVSLAYEDKCWDFQASVGGEPSTTWLHGVDRDWLLGQLVGGGCRNEELVSELVEAQRAAAMAARRELGLYVQ